VGKGRIAIVPPRFGDDVVGGAEAVLREIGDGLAARDWEVDVLTTCARSHYDWQNAYPPGASRVGDVTVHRFRTVQDGERTRRDVLEGRIQLGLPIDADEQQVWLHGNARVPDLFHYLVREQANYRAIVLAPYLFWTTATCWRIAPHKTIVMPCLHDEHYAYLDVFRPVLSEPAQVWFLSEPEHELAHKLGPVGPHRVTGAGVHELPSYDASRFARSRPFVLYAGRREDGKGWPQCLGAFTRAVVEFGADLDLVTFGVGPVDPAPAVADRVHDLGFLPQEQIGDAFSAAAAYIQPSPNESFSVTLMQSWLAGTPVIANAASEVVAWHCRRSGAGVVYESAEELVQALVLLGADPHALDGMAAAGRDYVLREYAWPRVLDGIEEALEELP
jgi:glycosyltransferase involved in cell wall biosynthesis